jgi:Fe-S-cluster-containing dehydrogenase component
MENTKEKIVSVTVDMEKCMGCEMCMMECAAHDAGVKDLPIVYPQSWRLISESRLTVEPGTHRPVRVVCRNCEHTPCVDICPKGAIRVVELLDEVGVPKFKRTEHTEGVEVRVSA